MTDLTPIIAEAWKAVKEDEARHAKYAEASEADKLRYAGDVVEFRTSMEGEGKTEEEINDILGIKEKVVKEKKVRVKKVKGPKKPSSGYQCYSKEQLPLLQAMEEHKEKKMTDLTPIIAEAWKAVKEDEAKLAKYTEAAAADMTRYEEEVGEFRAKMEEEGKTAEEIEELVGTKRKAKAPQADGEGSAKKPKKPKKEKKPRAKSAYMFYSAHVREQVKAENREISSVDIMKKVGAMWKEVTAEEKKPFEEQAAADKVRVQEEIAKLPADGAASDAASPAAEQEKASPLKRSMREIAEELDSVEPTKSQAPQEGEGGEAAAMEEEASAA